MTLIVTVNGPESIWMLADRRLSFNDRPPKDDGRKLMFLRTADGDAILGYTGLGATALGTEPADWMSAVLRGRNLSLEQSLACLAEAANRQLPRHVARLPVRGAPAHSIIASAFLGDKARLYTIDLEFARDRRRYRFRFTRHVHGKPTPKTSGPPLFAMGGSGASYCSHLSRTTNWMPSVLCAVKAYDRGRISPHAVADCLANLNMEVHKGMPDQSVGPRCIVAWRQRKGGIHIGGGGHEFYTERRREGAGVLPTICIGMDEAAVVGVLMPIFAERFKAVLEGAPAVHPTRDELNAALARISNKPEEDLV